MSAAAVTVAVAAEFMGLSRRHARKRLVWLHQQHPEKGLLRRPSGCAEGHIEVNPYQLRLVVLGEFCDEQAELSLRVGLVESDITTLKTRLDRINTRLSQLKNSQEGAQR
jgi:hypothetical protein